MATEVLLPQWGMEMAEGTIVKWLKNEGDPIQEGEPLVAIETAKVETDLESIATGVLTYILVPEGATVPIRTLLAVIGEPGEDVPRPASSSPSVSSRGAASPVTRAPVSAGQEGARVQVVPAARRLAQENRIDLALVQGSGPGGRVLIADVERAIASPPPNPAALAAPARGDADRVQVVPAARRLARQNGIDLATVQGSGPGGRILIADVEQAIAPPPQADAEGVPLTGMRRAIASRMMQSLQMMAQVTLTTEADLTSAMTLRAGLARQWDGLSPLAMVIKATARALGDHSRLNAVQGEDKYQVMPSIDIGIAVSLEEGLITPVLRGADGKELPQIAAESRELASLVREGRAKPEDVTGGTFTITNLGAHGVDGFTPIINPPQVAILGVGRVVEKPVIHDGEIVKGWTMYLSLTFDHRVVDGSPAAEFLETIRCYLEDPWWMVA